MHAPPQEPVTDEGWVAVNCDSRSHQLTGEAAAFRALARVGRALPAPDPPLGPPAVAARGRPAFRPRGKRGPGPSLDAHSTRPQERSSAGILEAVGLQSLQPECSDEAAEAPQGALFRARSCLLQPFPPHPRSRRFPLACLLLQRSVLPQPLRPKKLFLFTTKIIHAHKDKRR